MLWFVELGEVSTRSRAPRTAAATAGPAPEPTNARISKPSPAPSLAIAHKLLRPVSTRLVGMSKRHAQSPSPSGSGPSPFAHLHIQAHEANLVRNQDSLAQTVEYSPQTCSVSATTDVKGKGKTRMIRWVPEGSTAWAEADTLFALGKAEAGGSAEAEAGYWVDR